MIFKKDKTIKIIYNIANKTESYIYIYFFLKKFLNLKNRLFLTKISFFLFFLIKNFGTLIINIKSYINSMFISSLSFFNKTNVIYIILIIALHQNMYKYR